MSAWHSLRLCSISPQPQRAILILRDVLAWQASEVAAAEHVDGRVNSSLQRARAQVTNLTRKVRRALDRRACEDILADYVAAFARITT